MAEQHTDQVADVLAQFARAHPAARVLDIGGGSGTRAVPLAAAGATVLVIDASTDALASLSRRAAEAGVFDRIEAVQADADQLGDVVDRASFDLVLYHHVVQDVDNPVRSLAAAAAVLRPGGTASIVVPGRLAAVISEAAAGRYESATAMLGADPAVDRQYDVPSLRALIENAGLTVESVTGLGVMSSLMDSSTRVTNDPPALTLEGALREHPILGQVAQHLHSLATRP